MIRRRDIAMMIFAASSATPAAADPWTAKNYADDKFRVEWSGPVVASKTDLSKATPEQRKVIEHSTQYLQDSGAYAYIVNAQHNKTNILFDKGNAASIGTLHCKSLLDKTLDIDGAQAAKEMVGTDCDNNFRVRARYFLGSDNWYYQVMAVMDPTSSLDDGQHFVESFKLTGK